MVNCGEEKEIKVQAWIGLDTRTIRNHETKNKNKKN